MKKWITLVVVATLLTFGTFGLKTNADSNWYGNDLTDWTTWKSCFGWDGLDFRVKCEYYDQSAQKYFWGFEFRNRYKETIHFGFRVTTVYNTADHILDQRVTLDPEQPWPPMTPKLFPLGPGDAEKIGIYVGDVRFGPSDSGPYVQPGITAHHLIHGQNGNMFYEE